jgi:alpha-D-ribose 1-methylphosphonate 5-triphosphate synthase subunit PhnI
MATTFNDTLATAKDRVRFRIGDTGPAFDLTDETIQALLAENSEPLTVAKAARAVAAKLSRSADVLDRDGDIRVEYKSRLSALENVAKEAEREHRDSLARRPDVQQGPRAARLTEPDVSGFRF